MYGKRKRKKCRKIRKKEGREGGYRRDERKGKTTKERQLKTHRKERGKKMNNP